MMSTGEVEMIKASKEKFWRGTEKKLKITEMKRINGLSIFNCSSI